MKLRKILAVILAAVLVSATAISASANPDVSEGGSFTAILGIADSSGWSFNTFDSVEGDTWTRNDVVVTADGTYTVSVDVKDYAFDGLATFIWVDMFANPDSYSGMTGEIVSVKVDGATKTGEGLNELVAEDGRMRIAVANPWTPENGYLEGADSWIDIQKIEVTFSVSGMGGGAAANETPEATQAPANVGGGAVESGDKEPDTGLGGAAVLTGLAVLAAGAVVVSKKRK